MTGSCFWNIFTENDTAASKFSHVSCANRGMKMDYKILWYILNHAINVPCRGHWSTLGTNILMATQPSCMELMFCSNKSLARCYTVKDVPAAWTAPLCCHWAKSPAVLIKIILSTHKHKSFVMKRGHRHREQRRNYGKLLPGNVWKMAGTWRQVQRKPCTCPELVSHHWTSWTSSTAESSVPSELELQHNVLEISTLWCHIGHWFFYQVSAKVPLLLSQR